MKMRKPQDSNHYICERLCNEGMTECEFCPAATTYCCRPPGQGQGRQGMFLLGSPYSPSLHLSGVGGGVGRRDSHVPRLSRSELGRRSYPGAHSCSETKTGVSA